MTLTTPEAMTQYIADRTGLDAVVVTTVLAVEHEYMYALGLSEGPEPAWLWYDPTDLADHPSVVDHDEIAAHIEATLAIPVMETAAILTAEATYLTQQELT